MKISQEVRDFARLQKAEAPASTASPVIQIHAALQEKAQQFREGGGQIYL